MSDDLKIDDGAASDDAVACPPKGHQRLGLALVIISIAHLMVVLDATIANIAPPFIGQDLDSTDYRMRDNGHTHLLRVAYSWLMGLGQLDGQTPPKLRALGRELFRLFVSDVGHYGAGTQ